MKRFSQRHQLSTLSELNITPLLDLAFVLLLIFMITTPLMEKSDNLVVPTSKAAPGAAGPADVETVAIDRAGLIQLNKVDATLDELVAELTALRESRPNLAIVVRADKELSVQKLVEVMDAIKKAGITKLGVLSTATGN
jgi:biopolymer transport protein ExbD